MPSMEENPRSFDALPRYQHWSCVFLLILPVTLSALPAASGRLAPDRGKHWAFQPVMRPSEPVVRESQWVRNAIDRFVLARLEQELIRPSPEADRETLIRRLSLDLLGLPPSLSEIDGFLADTRPDAYERLVDRLLVSPHYGERWGRHWLDLARYADSNGYTIDGGRSIWKYRDWVIQALNSDMPFDQFTVWQMAGDMLPDPSLDQLIATGFHRNTLRNEEGGTDQEQFRVDAVADRLSTTGSVFLGLTLGCARCHDHKYDPITQREYFEMFALLNSADEPTLPVPTTQQSKEEPVLLAEIAEAEKRLAMVDENSGSRQAEWERLFAGRLDVEWAVLDPVEYRSAGGATLTKLDDESLLVSGTIPDRDRYTIVAEVALHGITAVRLEALTHDSLPERGPGLAHNGNFVLSEFTVSAGPGPASGDAPVPSALTFAEAMADHSQDHYPIAAAIDGKPNTGWAINVAKGSLNLDRTAIFHLKDDAGSLAEPAAEAAEPRPSGPRRLIFELQQQHAAPQYNLGRFRLAVTAAPRDVVSLPIHVRQALAVAPEARNPEQKRVITEQFRKVDKERIPIAGRVTELKQLHQQLKSAITTTLIMRERPEPRGTFVHQRGDFLRPGEPVTPAVPAILPPLRVSNRTPNRLDFARWLVHPDHPLTPRVTMNRLWQQYFGSGIVATENDFGTQGNRPTHPELLDWLASEFIAQGWSLKAMHRLIVTSATYRQSSRFRPDLAARDANNKLLARQVRLRLEAEVIRDVALSASDLLSREIGGPGSYPPQPEGIYRFTQVAKYWAEGKGPDRYRRGLYTYFWRSSPYPFLTTFDAPDANVSCTRRVRSNTPLQALTLANDRGFFEVTQGLASRILREAPTPDADRIRYAFRLCLARPPNELESKQMAEFLELQRAQFQQSPEDADRVAPKDRTQETNAVEAAAWAAVARVLINLDEFITRE